LAQSNAALEKRIETTVMAGSGLTRHKACRKMMDILSSCLNRATQEAFERLTDKASGYIRNQLDIRDRFEIIEQEKAVLEEEFGNALTLNEDLQIQLE